MFKLISDNHINEGDMVAGGVTMLSLMEYLPFISAGLTALWVGLRIYILIRDEIVNRKQKPKGDE